MNSQNYNLRALVIFTSFYLTLDNKESKRRLLMSSLLKYLRAQTHKHITGLIRLPHQHPMAHFVSLRKELWIQRGIRYLLNNTKFECKKCISFNDMNIYPRRISKMRKEFKNIFNSSDPINQFILLNLDMVNSDGGNTKILLFINKYSQKCSILELQSDGSSLYYSSYSELVPIFDANQINIIVKKDDPRIRNFPYISILYFGYTNSVYCPSGDKNMIISAYCKCYGIS